MVVIVEPQASGRPGERVDVVGRGFDEGQPVEVRWDGFDGPVIGRAVGADFSVEVTVPEAKEGRHPLVVVSRDLNGVMGSGTSTDFTVTAGDGAAQAAPPPSSAPVPPQAPGTSGLVWAVVAGPLVVLAMGLVWARRRRRLGALLPAQGP